MTAQKPGPLDCPFCGGAPERARNSEAIRCKRGCTGWMHRDDWNQRADPRAAAQKAGEGAPSSPARDEGGKR